MKYAFVACLGAMLIAGPALAANGDAGSMQKELDALKQQVRELEKRLEKTQEKSEQAEKKAAAAEATAANAEPDIHVGGAVRFQYAYRDFSEPQKEREGNLELDTVRVNFDGEIGDVILSAEYRFYEYMDVIHHGWFGYDFADDIWQAQVGFHRVPFGILPYNSNNFFFSSNYYTGYEDDYDGGIKFIGDYDFWNLQLAYYANDEITFGARNERYSYDILRDDSGNELEENNTFNLRTAYTMKHGPEAQTELGVSGQYGQLASQVTGRGVADNEAFAAHLHGDYGPWGVMLQAMRYEYDLDNDDQILGVGAYAFDDVIPAKAYSYTANLSYSWPVEFGAISNIKFYNDFSYVTDKSANLPGTWMNVLGAAVTAGGLFTYVDLVHAKNQPFIGGSLGGAGDEETRFNINFGYYF